MKILFLFITFTFALFATSKEVLLLHSYHKGYTWSDEISKAVERKFLFHENIELSTAYMDTKRVVGPLYFDRLASLYKEQFQKRNFDLIIVSDNNAFDFAIKYHEYLFKDLPVLFTGINNFDKALLDENYMSKYMSGVVEQVDIEKNFELILKLQPKLKKLIILNDTSKTGHAVRRDLIPIINKYKHKIEIEYIDNMDIKEIKNKVKNAQDDTAILFVLLFKDTTGKFFTYKQSFKQIKDVSSVPMYGLWDFYLDYGLMGGLLTSAKAQGEAVSKMAIEILNGKDIKEIPILEKSPNKYIFDYVELERFNIHVEDFLNEYTIINEPITIYKEYKTLVILSVFVILVLTILVITMRANIQRRVVLEEDLQNRIKFDKVLLDTLPNGIYYKNMEGKFLGCNKAFANLFNTNKKDVIGKRAKDFFQKDIAIKNELIDRKLLETKGTDTSELTLHFSNSSMKHIILNKAVYQNSDGSIGGIVCIMDDITERMQQKQFLIQQSKLAEMGDMIAAIAHQWNEPLVELSAQVQDIQTGYLLEELQTSDMENFVNDSMVQIKYMSQTLSDFRNFLKPSTSKTSFLIKESFDEIFEIIGKQIFYSNINFKINYENQDYKLMIYGYQNEFKQVLLNLINNAKNKIIEKNLVKKFNLTINVSSNINYNKIEIIDDGGKIDETIIGNLFEPYFTTKKDGTGFGLYMAKVIIEDKMQGHISVQNKDDTVIFTVKLPHKKGIIDETLTT